MFWEHRWYRVHFSGLKPSMLPRGSLAKASAKAQSPLLDLGDKQAAEPGLIRWDWEQLLPKACPA